MKVEIKKVTGITDQYNASEYPGTGFFVHNDGMIYFVNQSTSICAFVCFVSDIDSTTSEPESGSINEAFVLELTKVLTREKDK